MGSAFSQSPSNQPTRDQVQGQVSETAEAGASVASQNNEIRNELIDKNSTDDGTNASDKKTQGDEWNNFKHIDAGMDRWGKERLKLAAFMRDNVLDKLDIPWIIDNGTLLGAWRDNGTFIKHDDDFDIALLIDINKIKEKNNKRENVIAYANQLLPKIKKLLENTPYNARVVSSYTIKIEIFDESKGKYTLVNPRYNGADFYYVIFDMQFYVETMNECPNKCENKCYTTTYTAWPRVVCYDSKDIFPIETIMLEKELFNAPHDCEQLLKTIYGSLSKKAKFDDKTCLYYDIEE